MIGAGVGVTGAQTDTVASMSIMPTLWLPLSFDSTRFYILDLGRVCVGETHLLLYSQSASKHERYPFPITSG